MSDGWRRLASPIVIALVLAVACNLAVFALRCGGTFGGLRGLVGRTRFRRMKRLLGWFALWVFALGLRAAELLPVERQVAEAVKSSHVTVVHFWAPWCPNCTAELAKGGWSTFIGLNSDVDFIFVTVWGGDSGDGRALLEKNGVGAQPNFQLLVHPNVSRKGADKMTAFLGLPVSWIPSTWVFRDGELRYALNYGELHFPMLQQLVRDSAEKWER